MSDFLGLEAKKRAAMADAKEYTDACSAAWRLKSKANEAKESFAKRTLLGGAGLIAMAGSMVYDAIDTHKEADPFLLRTCIVAGGLCAISGVLQYKKHTQLTAEFDIAKEHLVTIETRMNAASGSYLRIHNESDKL